MKKLALAAALMLTPANAAPPENANPEYAPFFRALTHPQTGYGCCSEADCRPVEAEFKNNQWRVLIDKRTFGPNAPDEWRDVPEEAIIKKPPMGLPRPQEPIACWYMGGIRCFAEPAWGN